MSLLADTIGKLLMKKTMPAHKLIEIYLDIVNANKYLDVRRLVVDNLHKFLTDHGYVVDELTLI